MFYMVFFQSITFLMRFCTLHLFLAFGPYKVLIALFIQIHATDSATFIYCVALTVSQMLNQNNISIKMANAMLRSTGIRINY